MKASDGLTYADCAFVDSVAGVRRQEAFALGVVDQA